MPGGFSVSSVFKGSTKHSTAVQKLIVLQDPEPLCIQSHDKALMAAPSQLLHVQVLSCPSVVASDARCWPVLMLTEEIVKATHVY